MVATVSADQRINNAVFFSDTHIGCKMALCDDSGFELDEGGLYIPSPMQKKVFAHWKFFWDEWVPQVCHNEPFIAVCNGDAIDGVHHQSVTQITHNLTYQRQHAVKIIKRDVINHPLCAGYYHMRGTEAHGGKSGAEEEQMARELDARPNDIGQYARYELWLRLGPALVHVTHHIGTSGSAAYETTALNRELTNAYTEAGRWGQESPNFVVRSHRHRNSEIRLPTALGYGTCFATAGWQMKTPLVYRLGMKMSQPQFGGSMIRNGDEDVYSRHKFWCMDRPIVEEL